MTSSDNETPATRGVQHDALAVFLGTWRAEGKSYGSPRQPDGDPKSAAEPWVSTHTGRCRHYDLTVDGRVWTITGKMERARIEFSGDGRSQTITWEWRPKDRWLPLCDRVARRDG
jgi:hypothetical protein